MTIAQPTQQSNQLTYLRDLIRELCIRDIKLRYKRSILGIAWSLIHSLAQMRIFRFIFGSVLAVGVPNYTAFLFTGILAWSWFAGSLSQATTSITSSRELVRQSGFPVTVLPIVTLLTQLIDFVLAFPILLIFIYGGGGQLNSTLAILPLIMILQFIFTLGLAYIFATIQVTFRDMRYIVQVGLGLGFFLTPIFYDISRVPEQYQAWFQLNPLAHILDAYRSILIYGTTPNILPLLVIGLWSMVILIIGNLTFTKASHRFAEEL